ncbi:uncharacterized protein At4g28440-like [Ipomoea triloba]|uniref:uncharacterized protein At4g28440-like n=1 Tax=Ipomoea triloba TaxID=35885 RepID=UPI00125D8D06|nr:uncharacterized protein At4g28440-like [Ipomoea triloba]GLL49873.1 uncharacterized protein At4g28440-like [Ipomoea trifida]GME11791.1 replication factor A1 [Ipomoea batatas]GME13613.1 replication factor A1 [Ipomoea batatas]GME18409.1 replication factor A1 [Ipomoea batatas]
MAELKKKQGGFTKVNQLRPLDTGVSLTVKVVSSKQIAQRGRPQGRFAECLVGDETGMVIFSARNDQVDLMQEGNTIVVTNAKVDMFKGSMRLAVDRFGRVEITEAASFSVPEDINMSLIEFERIDVVV